MDFKIIRASEIKTSNWAGGTTSELYIYPNDSNYADRDFKFRISTATVEIEESTFTPLTGISRTLMVLDGEMDLVHAGQHQISLGKFDVDHFKGGWLTTSKGTCKDFNLMCRENYSGSVEGVLIEPQNELNLQFALGIKFVILYNLQGQIEFQNEVINKGDVLILEDQEISQLSIKVIEKSEIVLVNISEQ